MIIELFGPPAAGKTTFARTLAAQVRSSGRPVELIMSVRPGEAEKSTPCGAADPALSGLRRLIGPAQGILAGVVALMPRAYQRGTTTQLLRLLPPANPAATVRLRQYMERLERSWRVAERTEATVIFDQGYVQLLCSLLLYVRTINATAIEEAVAAIPKADQWIHLGAPRELLEARLEARRRSQSWLERQFEPTTQDSLRSIEILSMLESILRRAEPRVVHVGAVGTWPGECGRNQSGMELSSASNAAATLLTTSPHGRGV